MGCREWAGSRRPELPLEITPSNRDPRQQPFVRDDHHNAMRTPQEGPDHEDRGCSLESPSVGRYSYGKHAQLFAGHPDEDYLAANMHESLHAHLASATTLGAIMSAPGSLGPEAPKQFRDLLDWLVDETRPIQESMATYGQWVVVSSHLSRDAFVATLQRRGPEYAQAFLLGSRVEEILDHPSARAWNEQDRRFVCHCLLLDICTFAMSPRLPRAWFKKRDDQLIIAVPAISPAQFTRFVGKALPKDRFKVVVQDLATTPDRRQRLITKAMPVFECWLEKYRKPRFQQGDYVGISMYDNVHAVLQEMFHQFAHASQFTEAARFGVKPPSSESAESFLRRTEAVEFTGEPEISLVVIPPPIVKTVTRLLETVSKQGELGCYLKLVVNLSATVQLQNWNGSRLPIEPQRALLIFFGAELRPDHAGRNEWMFQAPALCGIIDVPALHVLMGSARSDNILTCIETRGALADSVRLLSELAKQYRRSFFAHLIGKGIGRLIDLFTAYAGLGGADVHWTRNAIKSFHGGGSSSLSVAFVVPRLPLRNMAWVYITTPDVMYSIYEIGTPENNLIPPNIVMHGLPHGSPVGFYVHSEHHPQFIPGPLWRASDDPEYGVLGPWSGEIVMTQLTKMGF